MLKRDKIDSLLREQPFHNVDKGDGEDAYTFAAVLSEVENCLVVVSDLKANTSRIFHGCFSKRICPDTYRHEDSIWEDEILKRMDASEREEKYLAELRFFNFLKHLPRARRRDYYLASRLRFNGSGAETVDVLHRMYYRYANRTSDTITHGICVYGPLLVRMPARNMAINSVTGEMMELSCACDNSILTKREKQILSLIERGLNSRQIADKLCISIHTVSRHRQDILARLQAANSTEAISKARMLKIL